MKNFLAILLLSCVGFSAIAQTGKKIHEYPHKTTLNDLDMFWLENWDASTNQYATSSDIRKYVTNGMSFPTPTNTVSFIDATNAALGVLSAQSALTNNDTRSITFTRSVSAGSVGTSKAYFTNGQQYGISLIQPNVGTGVEGLVRINFATNQVDNGGSLWWAPRHGEPGGEMGITSQGNISLNPSLSIVNPSGGGIQLGTTGWNNDRLWVQYNDDPAASVYAGAPPTGQSKILEFASRYKAGGVLTFSRRFGFRQEVQDTNGNTSLILYSRVPDVTWNGVRVDGNYGTESGAVRLVEFGTNAVTVSGSIIITNSVISTNSYAQFRTINLGSYSPYYSYLQDNKSSGLDISSGKLHSFLVGGDFNAEGRTDNADKYFYSSVVPYNHTNAFPALFLGKITATENTVQYGGGSGVLAPMTSHEFYASSNPSASGTGTKIATINATGLQMLGASNYVSGSIGVGGGIYSLSGGTPSLTIGTNIAGHNGTTFYGDASGVSNLNASAISSGTVPTARLGSGTANSTTYLRGDQTWGTPAGGAGSVSPTTLMGRWTVAPTAVNTIRTMYLSGSGSDATSTKACNIVNRTITITNVWAGFEGSSYSAGTNFHLLIMTNVPGQNPNYAGTVLVLQGGMQATNSGTFSLTIQAGSVVQYGHTNNYGAISTLQFMATADIY